jgi:release factor glutamine methyltransferase
MITIDALRTRYRELALERRINPRDVDILLGDAIDRPLPYLLAHGEAEMTAEARREFEEALARRFSGEPLQYIRGHSEFYGRDFLVDARVLIPRPETELLVESVLDAAPEHARVLDVGTGSGCIAVTIDRERPDLAVIASDRSFDALIVARTNARRLQSDVRFVCANALDAFRGELAVIVSNPPYIPEREYLLLDDEVREHEPPLALRGGASGLDVIEQLMNSAHAPLLMIEIGFGQERDVRNAAQRYGWSVEDVRNDLAGIARVVILGRVQ